MKENNETLEQLRRALLLQKLQKREGAQPIKALIPPITHVDRNQPLPLSLAQQRLWFLDQLDPAASAVYHIASALRLIGALNRQALKATLDRLVARHEGLRTHFSAVNGVPFQVIAPDDVGFVLIEQDLSDLDEETRARKVVELTAEEARTPFNLSQGPLIRGRLLRLSDDEHALLITQHHIISDGWSTRVMVRELAAMYTAFCEGQPDPLPALDIQYADYAAWQRGWLQGEVLTRQLNFWREHLRGAPELLELPTDRPRPPVQRHAGGSVRVTLTPALTARLRDLSRRHGTTLFMTMLAAWSLLLARLSGQSDLVVGTPVANRQRREVEGLIGFFINTLALRVRLGDATSVAELLQQVKDTTLSAFSHQELPFEQVVEAVQPVRSLSHSPLFQSMLSLNNTPESGEITLPGLRLAPVERSHDTTHFDLAMALSDRGDAIAGTMEYASDLFDRSTVERFAGHFVTLLEGMVADETQRASTLPLLTATQRDQLLQDFNDTTIDYPRNALVHQLFESQAAASPDAVAAWYDGASVSYGELNARANQLAHYLIGHGVRSEDRVAICAERNVELLVGMLAILKAGAAYVPLDPSHPVERLAYMLGDSAPKLLLTQADLIGCLPKTDVPALMLDVQETREILQMQPAGNPDASALGITAEHLAYVIYTSGSTGEPKGVMVPHRGIVRLVINNPYVRIAADDVVAHCANPAFDAATWEIWCALLHGAALLVIPQHVLLDVTALRAVLEARAVTVLHLTVGLFNQYAEALASVFRTLNYLLFGGEKADASKVLLVLRQSRPLHLVQCYGPTETTTFASTHEIDALAEDAHSVSIGRPIANTRIYILDGRGEPVPVGVTGELHIGGDGVARGYLNQPGLTAERFVADPFCAEVDARMYKTGDLGRWLPDGTIEYLGRNDFQVKIRGFRIELGEIEAKLSACEGVREAVVIAREDVPGDKRLVAYVVADDGVELSAASLRDGLSVQLPEYMVPGAFLQLAALPLTANGKLDRRALPAPDASALVQREYEAPQGDIEQTLARLWQSLLGVEQVGRHDHFFELGGHSLLAVQLMSHIRAGLDVEVPLRALFAQPTLQALAEAVAQAGASTLGRIEPADRSQPLPLSLAQQRLWFLDQLDPAASGAYHISAALRLFGVLNREALQATLDRLVARHEGLRTCFVALDGVPYQVIAPDDAGFVLTHQDLGDIGEQARASKVAEVARDEARAPFDMAQGPVIRGQLLRLSDDEHVLLLTQHHIISDGWSTGVMVREVGALYTAFCQGQPDPLPALTIQYADYAAWQRGWLQGEELERQVAFWRDHLRDAPALLELPTDRPRPPVQSHAGGTVSLTLPATLTAGLRTLSQRHGVTLFMTLLAGWSALLSRLSGQDDVVIGTPVANRQRREVEDLIGFFVNTLAVRVRLDDRPSVAQLLQQVKETTLSAFGHQELPFEQVVEAVQPIRSLSHSPIAQVTFTWHNQPDGGELILPGLTLAPVERSHTTTQADLSLHLTDAGEVFAGALVYATALFDQATIERMAGHFVSLLEGMVKAEQAGIHTVPLPSAHEREQLLYGFNDTAVAYPQDALIHEQFQAQAAAQPEAVAVVCGDESLSYGELEARANQLAHYLMGQGVKPDDRVAIAVERGIDLIVGLLGILKAGGAYVPLDPSYPAERLAWMLEDSDSRFLLTQTEVEAHLPALSVPVLRLDVDFPVLARRLPTHAPDTRAQGLTERHLAYVIYTSGSTGTPKGVMVDHRCVNRLVLNNPYFAATQSDCFAHCANPAFDAATWEIWGALLNGARLCVVPQAQVLDPAQLNASLVTGGVTALWLTVGLFNQYVDALAEAFGQLRYLLVGGDALDPRSIRRLLARERRPVHVVNGYGPTETTTFACTHDIGAVAEDARSIPLGRPIANTRVYILDAQGEPVPIGAVGELYIGGHGVARGYLNRPELTQERFVADRFTTEADARMYKTGDLGRWRSDGTIEYLGRNDFQVKIRGFRIELGEIEAKLSACDGVREAVVIAREDVPGDKRLVAYVVSEEGVELSAASLRDGLSLQLPEYMVPGAFLQLESLPLTANGKLDRRALPAPDASALVQREYEAPQGEIEQTLARLWQDLLGVEQVGRHDQFFELGGHSLLVVALVERLRGEGLKGEVRAIFATPTLSDYAATLVRADATESAVPANDITPQTTQITPELLPLIALTPVDIERIVATVPGGVGNIQDIYPLLPLQEGLLFHHLLETHGDTYLLREAMAFDSRSRLDTFLRVLEQVIGRHDIFRTAVLWEGLPRPVQVVYRRATLPVHELVLAGADSALEELLARTDPKHLRLDLRTAPMFAAYIAKDAANGEWLLSLLYHHLVCDHMTLALVMGEMRALLSGAGESLAPAASLRSIVAQAGTTPEADHEAYFRQELGDIDEPTAPFGVLNVQVGGSELETAHRRLDGALAQRIRDCARGLGVSPAVLFHVAWAQVLARCTGRDDVVFGTVLSGRLQGASGADRAVGMFINTLPIRIAIGDRGVRQVVQESYQRMVALLAHEQASLAMAQRCSGVPAQLPLFTALLNYRHSEDASVSRDASGLEGIRLLQVREAVNYPVSMSVDDYGQGFAMKAQCVQGVDASRINSYLMTVVEGLIDALSSDADRALHELEILTPTERTQLLRNFNDTEVGYSCGTMAHELFEAQALARPDAVALICEDQSLTYAELNARANQLAHHLIAQGVRPDDRVAICAERSLDMVVGLIGILKSGAGYVPLDPNYPLERLAYMVEDCAPKVVLTQLRSADRLPGLAVPTLTLDAMPTQAMLAAQPTHNPQPRARGATSRHLAYVIYTSGSTGMPKGVMIHHQGLVNYLEHADRSYLGEDIRGALVSTPFGFDATVTTLMAPWLAGKPVVLLPEDSHECLAQLLNYSRQSDPWLFKLTPAHLDALTALNTQAPVSTAHVLVVGGEQLTRRCLRKFREQVLPNAVVINEYGPTETVVGCSTHVCAVRDDGSPGDAEPIGRPLANTRIYILDAHGQPVPIDVTGEMYVAGAGVARGYLNQPGLTAERFLADPFCAEVDARMYRTGDLGRWLPDGTIEYLGRNDFQVKIRGFRIELGEIEAKLSACDGVREAVVIAREDVPGDKRLVAYVVADDGVEPSAAALRSALAAQLPDYMVPSAFVVLEALPLTINGKLDRKALPMPDGAALVSHAYVAPENEAEQRLTEIWQQLLRVPALGVEDNFFALGGDSILAIQVVTRANMAGIAITTRQLFEAQTIRALARLAGSAPQVVPPQGEVEGELTLLPIQQMFLRDDDADRHHFNQSLLLRTPEGCTAQMLRAMVVALFQRHDALRLGFVEHDGQWQAVHRPWDEAQLDESCIVEALPERVEERAAFISTRCQHWQEAFDLARGPLLRAVYFADGAGGEGRLLLSVHHLVVDGVSWRVLLTDLEQAYDQCLRGEAVRLAAKTSSLQQWGAALTRHAHSAPMQGEKGLWLTQSRSRLSPLPVDHEHGGSVLADTKTAAIRLSAEETRALLQQCHGAYRTQINELLLSGVYLGLRAWTGEAAFRLRMEGHGREALFDDLDINQTVGWFTSVYPLLLHSQSADVGAVIKSVKEQYRAIPNHGIGYGLLRYLSGDDELAKAESGNAAELEFNYLGQFDQVINAETRFQAAPESGGSNASGQRRRACRLSLNGMVFGGELQLTLSYSGREYEAATIERVLGLLMEGLRQVIAHCQAPGVGGYTPSDFPLAQLGQEALEELQQRYPSLNRLYPATPMQAGLHFHSLLDRSAYMVQKFLVLRGTLGVDAFRQAWQQLLARHDILRTAFVGSNEAMHQVVVNALDVCWHEADWRDLDAATQAARFEAYRQQDKQSGFAFEQPGLMRIALFRLGEDRYQLLWTLHHILVDGWCFPLLYRDVMRLYYAALAGERAQLNDPPPYETYIDWLHRQGVDEARAYWRAQLSDIEAPTPLVIDRLPGDGGEGHYEPMLSLTLEETQALRALAKARHITINTLLQWSWAYLLHRYSGESDVVFGNVISGRPAELPGVDQMVGLFINTIPVRMTFDDGRSVAESLTALHENFQRASDYGYLSLLDIQQQSGVPGGRALFDSMLVFGNYPMDALHDGSGVSSEVPLLQIEYTENEDLGHYKLGLRAALRERLEVGFVHKRKDFSRAGIERLMAHYGRVLRQLPTAVEQGEAALSLLPDDEREQLLQTFNATAVEHPQDALIHELFEAQAAAQPDAVALVCEDQRLSYAELNARANQLAHYLLGQGVKPDDRVAICMERGLDMVVGLLGILKAGAAYVPLDPAYPVERLTYLLEDCAPALLLTQSEIEEQLHDLELPVLRLDVDFPVLARRLPTHAPDTRSQGLTARHLAYVIYTSGSTGLPKGVMVEHHSVCNMAQAHRQLLHVEPGSRMLQFASVAFDVCAAELFTALISGAQLCLAPRHQLLPGLALRTTLRELGVTHALLPVGAVSACETDDLAGLQYLMVGGDVCPPELVRNLRGRMHFFNVYGPTETTVAATAQACREDYRISVPIGRPMANARIYILDSRGQPVPMGLAGEIHIGGAGVARGYWNRSELTRERFLEDPFSGSPDARMYKTGDLGRWLPDGTVEYLGRNDFQVKIRGFRIELGEIEAKLAACSGVREAAVITREDVPGDKRLVAYVVTDDGTELPVAELRAALAAQLPDYMVPAAFMQLESMPLTPNGKLDRRALPAPDATGLATQEYEAPEGELEQIIAGIWQQLLGVEQVGRHDNFFALGGHSLLAVRMLGTLNLHLGIDVSIREIFDRTTIFALARYLEQQTQLSSLRAELTLTDARSHEELIEI